MPGRRFVLLDRDGTVIVDRHYLGDPDGVTLLGGAAEGLRRLSGLGFGLAVVSNQSGVGRGYFAIDAVTRVNARMSELLAAEGVRLDGIYFCPHAPDAGCRCRKPRPGLVERAARELDFEAARGFVVGDQPTDVALGHAVGATTFLLRSAQAPDASVAGDPGPNHVVRDLNAVADLLKELLS
jgi:D-glycero-D-manno-heptose 1,7-bisphosphate phosphatase